MSEAVQVCLWAYDYVSVCVCVFAKGSALRSGLSLSVSFGWLRALHLSSLWYPSRDKLCFWRLPPCWLPAPPMRLPPSTPQLPDPGNSTWICIHLQRWASERALHCSSLSLVVLMCTLRPACNCWPCLLQMKHWSERVHRCLKMISQVVGGLTCIPLACSEAIAHAYAHRKFCPLGPSRGTGLRIMTKIDSYLFSLKLKPTNPQSKRHWMRVEI